MAKLNAREATVLKAMIEGYGSESCFSSLYNRLKWDTKKVIKLSFVERDNLDSHYHANLEVGLLGDEEKTLLEKLIPERIK